MGGNTGARRCQLLAGRVWASYLEKELGVPVIVSNMAGAPMIALQPVIEAMERILYEINYKSAADFAQF